MNWIPRIFRRNRLFDELSKEMRLHMDEHAERLMREGESPQEARRQARIAFGNPALIEERSREVWQWPALEGILRDVRYAVRRLGKSPGFTAAVILTLGLGIGANIAVYGLVDAVLLRPLQLRNEKRLVEVFEDSPVIGLTKNTPAPKPNSVPFQSGC